MHEDPQIPNFGELGTGPELAEGMVLAVEPMVNAGAHGIRVAEDNWSVYSQDGSLAAHFEHTVAITGMAPESSPHGTSTRPSGPPVPRPAPRRRPDPGC